MNGPFPSDALLALHERDRARGIDPLAFPSVIESGPPPQPPRPLLIPKPPWAAPAREEAQPDREHPARAPQEPALDEETPRRHPPAIRQAP